MATKSGTARGERGTAFFASSLDFGKREEAKRLVSSLRRKRMTQSSSLARVIPT